MTNQRRQRRTDRNLTDAADTTCHRGDMQQPAQLRQTDTVRPGDAVEAAAPASRQQYTVITVHRPTGAPSNDRDTRRARVRGWVPSPSGGGLYPLPMKSMVIPPGTVFTRTRALACRSPPLDPLARGQRGSARGTCRTTDQNTARGRLGRGGA